MCELSLFSHGECVPAPRWHENMPQIEPSSEIGIIQYKLITDTRTLIPWCVRVERIPFIHGWNLEEVQKEEENGQRQCPEDIE